MLTKYYSYFFISTLNHQQQIVQARKFLSIKIVWENCIAILVSTTVLNNLASFAQPNQWWQLFSSKQFFWTSTGKFFFPALIICLPVQLTPFIYQSSAKHLKILLDWHSSVQTSRISDLGMDKKKILSGIL